MSLAHRLRGFAARTARRVLYPLLGPEQRRRVRDERHAAALWQGLQRDPELRRRVDQILALRHDDPRLSDVLAHDERALPSDPAFQATGYHRTMFIRYALAMEFAAGRRVLDTCSGLGWGAYLVDAVAARQVTIEIDAPAIAAARRLWPYRQTTVLRGSVLGMPFPDASFDVVLAMESIEHFTAEDGARYFREVHRVLRPGGWLIGSTPLPETAEEVAKEKARNPYHLHVFTPPELLAFLGAQFSEPYIYARQRYFRARR